MKYALQSMYYEVKGKKDKAEEAYEKGLEVFADASAILKRKVC